MRTKFVIVDPGLDRVGGHNYTLAMTFSDAARELGHEVLWLCHKEFPSELVPSYIRAEGIFSVSYFDKSRVRWHVVKVLDRLADRTGSGPAGALARRLSWRLRPFARELAAALRNLRIGPADHAFVTTAEYLQYRALLEILSGEGGEDAPYFHVRTSCDESYLWNRRFGRQLPNLFRSFRDLGVVGRQITFYAETPELAAHFGTWNLIPFQVLGNPVPQEFLGIPTHAGGADKALTAEKPLTIVFPGLPRREKGYLRLPRIAIDVLGRTDLARPVRFVFQSFLRKSGAGGWARWRDRDRRTVRDTLGAYPESVVQLVDRPLSNEEYYGLIAGADILLLPYQADRYRNRPSMIVSEAALFGKPVVVTAGTALAEFVAPGTGETASTDAEFADGLARIINDYDTYRAKAEARAATIRQEMDPRALVRRMVADAAPATARACVG